METPFIWRLLREEPESVGRRTAPTIPTRARGASSRGAGGLDTKQVRRRGRPRLLGVGALPTRRGPVPPGRWLRAAEAHRSAPCPGRRPARRPPVVRRRSAFRPERYGVERTGSGSSTSFVRRRAAKDERRPADRRSASKRRRTSRRRRRRPWTPGLGAARSCVRRRSGRRTALRAWLLRSSSPRTLSLAVSCPFVSLNDERAANRLVAV